MNLLLPPAKSLISLYLFIRCKYIPCLEKWWQKVSTSVQSVDKVALSLVSLCEFLKEEEEKKSTTDFFCYTSQTSICWVFCLNKTLPCLTCSLFPCIFSLNITSFLFALLSPETYLCNAAPSLLHTMIISSSSAAESLKTPPSIKQNPTFLSCLP